MHKFGIPLIKWRKCRQASITSKTKSSAPVSIKREACGKTVAKSKRVSWDPVTRVTVAVRSQSHANVQVQVFSFLP